MSMRKIYREIARKNGVTTDEVKREMQEALEHAYKNTPNDGITGAYQNRVPRRGEVPTPEEFVRYAASQLKNKT